MGKANSFSRRAFAVASVLLSMSAAHCSSSQSTTDFGGDGGATGDVVVIGLPPGSADARAADGALGLPPVEGGGLGGALPDAAGVPEAATPTPDSGTPTMTTPDATGPGTGPGTGGEDAGATAAENEWLIPQNAARAAVGEAPLTWDPIAAAVATAYAAKCEYLHNPNATPQYDGMGGGNVVIGENIAAGEPTESIAAAVASWVDEKQWYTHASNSCNAPSGEDCGHYTQIVWKATTAVGCAHVSCTTNSPFGSGIWDYSVCDYSPAGNYVGESPY